MTEAQIREDERQRWAKIALMLALHAKRHTAVDPSYGTAWKMFAVFSQRLLDNDAPTGDDQVLGEIASLFQELGLSGPKV